MISMISIRIRFVFIHITRLKDMDKCSTHIWKERIGRKTQSSLQSNERSTKGTMQLLGHANHRPISSISLATFTISVSVSDEMG